MRELTSRLHRTIEGGIRHNLPRKLREPLPKRSSTSTLLTKGTQMSDNAPLTVVLEVDAVAVLAVAAAVDRAPAALRAWSWA